MPSSTCTVEYLAEWTFCVVFLSNKKWCVDLKTSACLLEVMAVKLQRAREWAERAGPYAWSEFNTLHLSVRITVWDAPLTQRCAFVQLHIPAASRLLSKAISDQYKSPPAVSGQNSWLYCLCGRTIVSTVLCSYLEIDSLNNWRPSAIAEKWDASEAPELLGIKCSFALSFHSTPPSRRGLCLFREQLPEAVGPTSKL